MGKLLSIAFLWSLLVNIGLVVYYHISLWGIETYYSSYIYLCYFTIGLLIFKMWLGQKWVSSKGIQLILICSLIIDSIWPFFWSKVLEEVINLTLYSDPRTYSDYRSEHYQLLKRAQVTPDRMLLIHLILFGIIVMLSFFERRQAKQQNQDILDAP